jgi:threonine dehydrogenase-like Zn-dependent dehydrogenase
MLKARGVDIIVASDFSPGRRSLAWATGATVVVDPTDGSPYDAVDGSRWVRTIPDAAMGAVATVEKLQRSRLHVPWHVVWRTAERLGARPQRPVIFECVGAPGVIDTVITSAPLFSRVVVVGVCMEPDRFRPVMAINKEIELRFVVGYTPLEFRDTLHLLAEGKVDAGHLVTGTVGLDGVAAAFDALGQPEQHAKILIDPRSDATTP